MEAKITSHDRSGLLDEIQIHRAHVLLGEGRGLFEHVATSHIELDRMSVIESPGSRCFTRLV